MTIYINQSLQLT